MYVANTEEKSSSGPAAEERQRQEGRGRNFTTTAHWWYEQNIINVELSYSPKKLFILHLSKSNKINNNNNKEKLHWSKKCASKRGLETLLATIVISVAQVMIIIIIIIIISVE